MRRRYNLNSTNSLVRLTNQSTIIWKNYEQQITGDRSISYGPNDFNRLAALDEQGVNDWETALQIAVSLYLDIINLLLELLEATSN